MALSAADRQKIASVVALLRESSSILFITGAGISADSNLPTYRGVGGIYNNEDTEEGVPIEQALSGGMFRRRPDLTWKYLSEIEMACRGAVPNRGHEVIAKIERRFSRVWTLTQNVDAFHHAAGSRNVIDIHGNLRVLLCTVCRHRREVEDYQELPIPPQCPGCGGMERPDVVLFDEMLPTDKVANLQRQLIEGFQMVFSIGTSSMFPYIVEPVIQAKRWRVPTVEINPGHTDISNMVDYKIGGGAAESLHAIWEHLEE